MNLKKKIGPLATYQWIALGTIGALLIVYFQRSRASSAATTDSTGSAVGPDPTTGADSAGGGLTAVPADPSLATEAPATTSPLDTLSSLASWASEYQALGQLFNPTFGQTTTPSEDVATQTGSVTPIAAAKSAIKSVTTLNKTAGNPRAGKSFRTVINSKGQSVHRYGTGNNVKDIIVAAAPSHPVQATHHAPAAHTGAPSQTTHVNAKTGETYRELISHGMVVHRYGSGSNYHDVPIRKAS